MWEVWSDGKLYLSFSSYNEAENEWKNGRDLGKDCEVRFNPTPLIKKEKS